jgi:glycosyltransferase involved in cell wall biosynthesis
MLITRQFPLDYPGGETSHLFGVAHEMRKIGHEIYLMPVTDHPSPASLWPPAFTRDVPPFGLHHLFDSFAISRAAADFLRTTPVDVILSWQYETAYLGAFTRARNFIHGMVTGTPFGLLKRMARRNPARALAYHFFHFRQLRQAQVIFCPSHYAKSELVQMLGLDPQKIVVTHLSADAVFQPAAQPASGPLKNFIFAGSFEPIKGLFDAIAALGLVAGQGCRDWTLKIAGWGDTDAVLTAARAAGIAAHLQFLGRLDRPALAEELAHADLAILPSHTETFGLSIAEAQACGVPVVSYAIGGIPEVVSPAETGLLVPGFDQAALAQAILSLIQNPERARQMGWRGAQTMREKFSWAAAAQQMIATLEELQAQPR